MAEVTKNEHRSAYLVGSGIASLSAAVLLIRDAGFKGRTSTSWRNSRWPVVRSMAPVIRTKAM